MPYRILAKVLGTRMFRVLSCLGGEHDLRLVGLAALVCFVAILVAVNLFRRAHATRGVRATWLGATFTAALLLTFAIVFHPFTAMAAGDMVADPPWVGAVFSLSPTMFALVVAGVTVFVLGMNLIGAVAYSRLAAKTTQFARARQQLIEESEEKLREQHLLLETAVNNMSHGLVLYDSQWRVVIYNRRYIEIYGLSADVVKPGCPLVDILEHRKATGTFSGDTGEYMAELRTSLAEGKTVNLVSELPNGCVISMSNYPLPDGKWLSTHEDITERHRLQRAQEQAEEQLREQHIRLDAALNSMRQGLLLFDSESRLILCNRRYRQMYGLSAQAARPGCTLRDLLIQRQATGTFKGDPDQYIARLVDSGKVETKAVDLPDGRTISVTNAPVQGGGWVSTHDDITERRRAEKELDRTRAFLNSIVESVPVPIFVKDAGDRRYLLVNRASEKFWGIGRNEIIGRTAEELFPRQDAALIAAHDDESVKSGELDYAEREVLTPRNGVRFASSRRLTITGHDGKPQYLIGVLQDATERRLLEQERDRNREFLHQIIDNIPVSIIVKDARERRIALINRATEELWGVSRDQVLGLTVHDLFPKERADAIAAQDDRVMQSDSAIYFDEHLNPTRPEDGRILTSKRLCIRRSDGGPSYLVTVIEDVTKRKSAELQLHQAQKMEAVGNLTGGLAHDFNNLLTIVIGNLDLLQGDVAGNRAAEHRIETILQASERGADLTRQMLAFSRRQPLHPKPVSVDRLIRNITRLLGRTLGETIAIQLRIAADLRRALVDESQLEAALVNISINARDAMPGGGMLTIEARNTALDADFAARTGGILPGDYVGVEITDTGTGMPPEVLNRVFEPFFTTKPVGAGTGLGLSMVYGFMKQSGGHVSACSEVGKGTTFKLYLPVAPPAEIEATDQRERAPATLAPSVDGNVILAVDDNPDVRATVVSHLRALGYQVREAADAHAALRILDSTDKIDLLFTDVVMPGGVNGKELATMAKAKRSSLKVLFTSGFPGTSLTSGSDLDSGDALLSKPYRKHELAKAIHEMLEAR